MGENERKSSRILLYVGIGFAAVIVLLVVFGMAFGGSYRKTLSEILPQSQINNLSTTETKKVKKITFQKQNETGCIEVTPDGIVRVYTVCNEKLDSANRVTETRNINKLFQLVREKDYKTRDFSDSENAYKVIVETESGTEIFYIVVDEGNESEELLDTLNDIIEDIPKSSPTPSPIYPTPSSPGASQSTQPASSQSPNPSPSPNSSEIVETFTCDFTESGDPRKPYNVSNVICTGEPSPAP
jgi:hypothetical protein